MRKLCVIVAVLAAAVMVPGWATAAGPPDGEIDIAGAELAGSAGGAEINAFGTLRCTAAGPLTIDVQVFQGSTAGVAAGSNNGLTCPAAGDQIKWVVTAIGASFVVGDKVTILAEAAGSTIATDEEEHVLRWGR